MKKCPYCDTISDRHTIGGEHCLSKRLTQVEARQSAMEALCELRESLLVDESIPEEILTTVLEHLDTALEKHYEETV